MHTLNYIRKNTYRRNDNIFKKVYGKRTLSKNFSLFRVNPYSKIKTILNIEIACLLIYLLLRTKLSANIVSISGVVWTLIGIIFLSFYNSFLFYLGIIILFLKLIPDYVDGQLALFQKKISLTGHELDGWAGNMSTIIILSGFYLHGIKIEPPKYREKVFGRINDINNFWLILKTNFPSLNLEEMFSGIYHIVFKKV